MSTKIVDELTREAESLGMYPGGKLKVEKGIPLPRRGREFELICATLAKMEVGDSVFIRCAPGSQRNHVGSLWHMAARATRRKAASRTVEGGVRIWRAK